LGQSVEWTRRNISPEEFEQWMDYYRVEPFGPLREDHRTAKLMTLVAKMLNAKVDGRDPLESDWFPELGQGRAVRRYPDTKTLVARLRMRFRRAPVVSEVA